LDVKFKEFYPCSATLQSRKDRISDICEKYFYIFSYRK